MSVATLTSKGQLTIPKDVRIKLHLEAGEKIAFRVDEATGSAVMFPMNKTVDEVFGILKPPGPAKPRSVEAMNTAIREKFQREYR
jgi:AbrB family looped-hinge helix DNA binding protein